MGNDLTVGQVSQAQENYTFVDPDGPEKTLTAAYEIGVDTKNGIGGFYSGHRLDFLRQGTVFDRQLGIRYGVAAPVSEKAGGYIGAGVDYTLFRNLSDEVAVYGSLGIDGRFGFDKNVVSCYSQSVTHVDGLQIDANLTGTPDIYHSNDSDGNGEVATLTTTDILYDENMQQITGINAMAEAEAIGKVNKNYFDTKLAFGIKYENENEGYLGLEFNLGTHTEVLPTAFTSTETSIRYDYVDGAITNPHVEARAEASTGKTTETSMYVGGQILAKGYITPNISYDLSGGLQLRPGTNEISPMGLARISFHAKK